MSVPTLRWKLEILADAAKYDASCDSSGTAKKDSRWGKGIEAERAIVRPRIVLALGAD